MDLAVAKRLLTPTAVSLLALICGGLSGWPPALWRSWSKHIADQVMLWAGPTKPPTNLIVVAIDDASLQQSQWFEAQATAPPWSNGLERWPWPRSAYGELAERLIDAGAKAVAINIIFAGSSARGLPDDQRFTAALQRGI